MDQRGQQTSIIEVSVDNNWQGDAFELTAATVADFELEVGCRSGFRLKTSQTKFRLPMRESYCLAKLVSFTHANGKVYRPKPNQGFTTWRQADRAIFSCESCTQQEDLAVYVVEQLPEEELNVFAVIRYKFAENHSGTDVFIGQSDLNFSRVIVGDEPPPLSLRQAYSAADANQLELLLECDDMLVGSTLQDAICKTTPISALRATLVPWPHGEITQFELAKYTTKLIVNDRSTLLVEQGQWGLGRGGLSVQLIKPEAEELLFILTTTNSDSFTYHKLRLVDGQAFFSVGGTISRLPKDGTLTLSLNGQPQTFSETGSFLFSQMLQQNDAYVVSLDRPDCAVAAGFGTIERQDVTDIMVTCVDGTDSMSSTDSGENETSSTETATVPTPPSEDQTTNEFTETYKHEARQKFQSLLDNDPLQEWRVGLDQPALTSLDHTPLFGESAGQWRYRQIYSDTASFAKGIWGINLTTGELVGPFGPHDRRNAYGCGREQIFTVNRWQSTDILKVYISRLGEVPVTLLDQQWGHETAIHFDGERLVFLAPREGDGIQELYAASCTNPTPQKIETRFYETHDLQAIGDIDHHFSDLESPILVGLNKATHQYDFFKMQDGTLFLMNLSLPAKPNFWPGALDWTWLGTSNGSKRYVYDLKNGGLLALIDNVKNASHLWWLSDGTGACVANELEINPALTCYDFLNNSQKTFNDIGFDRIKYVYGSARSGIYIEGIRSNQLTIGRIKNGILDTKYGQTLFPESGSHYLFQFDPVNDLALVVDQAHQVSGIDLLTDEKFLVCRPCSSAAIDEKTGHIFFAEFSYERNIYDAYKLDSNTRDRVMLRADVPADTTSGYTEDGLIQFYRSGYIAKESLKLYLNTETLQFTTDPLVFAHSRPVGPWFFGTQKKMLISEYGVGSLVYDGYTGQTTVLEQTSDRLWALVPQSNEALMYSGGPSNLLIGKWGTDGSQLFTQSIYTEGRTSYPVIRIEDGPMIALSYKTRVSHHEELHYSIDVVHMETFELTTLMTDLGYTKVAYTDPKSRFVVFNSAGDHGSSLLISDGNSVYQPSAATFGHKDVTASNDQLFYTVEEDGQTKLYQYSIFDKIETDLTPLIGDSIVKLERFDNGVLATGKTKAYWHPDDGHVKIIDMSIIPAVSFTHVDSRGTHFFFGSANAAYSIRLSDLQLTLLPIGTGALCDIRDGNSLGEALIVYSETTSTEDLCRTIGVSSPNGSLTKITRSFYSSEHHNRNFYYARFVDNERVLFRTKEDGYTGEMPRHLLWTNETLKPFTDEGYKLYYRGHPDAPPIWNDTLIFSVTWETSVTLNYVIDL